MKVICTENRAINLDPKEVTLFHSKETKFPVTKGEEYIVMGMIVYKDSNCIYYLVDNNFPCWIPYPLFNISDNQLPPYWFVKIFDKKTSLGDLFYLAGFSELCNNENYHDALMELESWALDIYFKRKDEIKEWYFEKW